MITDNSEFSCILADCVWLGLFSSGSRNSLYNKGSLLRDN